MPSVRRVDGTRGEKGGHRDAKRRPGGIGHGHAGDLKRGRHAGLGGNDGNSTLIAGDAGIDGVLGRDAL